MAKTKNEIVINSDRRTKIIKLILIEPAKKNEREFTFSFGSLNTA